MENEENENGFSKFKDFMSQILGKEEQDTEEELLNLVQEAEDEGEGSLDTL